MYCHLTPSWLEIRKCALLLRNSLRSPHSQISDGLCVPPSKSMRVTGSLRACLVARLRMSASMWDLDHVHTCVR